MAKKQKLSQACWAIQVTPKPGEAFFHERGGCWGTVELFETRDEAREYIRDQTFPVAHWTVVRVDVVKR